MRLIPIAIAALLVVTFSACETDPVTLIEETHPIELGDQNIHLVTFSYPGSDVAYINVHEDEYTSVEATRSILQEHGGRLTMIEHTGDRRIQFTLDNDTFSVDPNRIFTDNGIQMTLEDNDGTYSEAAHEQVSAFADRLLQVYEFEDQPVVVAMHNNRLNGFSIESYAEGGQYEDAAEDLYINPDRDINDFYYVTDRRFFNYFSEQGYNVILQDNDQVTDDGSLSVYSGYHGKPYINVEAGRGHYEMQVEMIEVMLDMFEELGYY